MSSCAPHVEKMLAVEARLEAQAKLLGEARDALERIERRGAQLAPRRPFVPRKQLRGKQLRGKQRCRQVTTG